MSYGCKYLYEKNRAKMFNSRAYNIFFNDSIVAAEKKHTYHLEVVEYYLKTRICLETVDELDIKDCVSVGKKICEYIKENSSCKDDFTFVLNEAKMIKGIERKLEIVSTFCIEMEPYKLEYVMDYFMHSLPISVSSVSDKIVPEKMLNIQVMEYFKKVKKVKLKKSS